MPASMMQAATGRVRPFTAAGAGPCTRLPSVAPSARAAPQPRVVRMRAAEEPAADAVPDAPLDFAEDDRRGPRRYQDDTPALKHFLPLPKPAHLIYIKPTVAVVAGKASRSSVGVKMTAGDNQLERYVIEYYSKSVK